MKVETGFLLPDGRTLKRSDIKRVEFTSWDVVSDHEQGTPKFPGNHVRIYLVDETLLDDQRDGFEPDYFKSWYDDQPEK